MTDRTSPKTCGESTCVHGIYICRIDQIPCARVKKCPVRQKAMEVEEHDQPT